MSFCNNFVADREAHTRAFTNLFRCEKGLKYAPLEILMDAWAIISDRNSDAVLVLYSANRNSRLLNPGIFKCIYSIGQDIHKYLV